MDVGKSVGKAISEHLSGDLESAMLHACMAVDGTARKTYPGLGVGARFTSLLRHNYVSILEPMAPGINLAETVFPIALRNASGPGGRPDIADILYVIHRCNHGHGAPLPAGYELRPDTHLKPKLTSVNLERANGDWVVQFSDRTVYGMLAVALLSPVNADQQINGDYCLTYTSTSGDISVRLDNGWWGRAAEFGAIAAMDLKRPRVKLDFTNVMPPLPVST